MNQSLLSIKDVSLHLASIDKPILRDINYQIFDKDFIIILGSNGSGKSSLLKCLDRRYQPTSGNIFLEEKLLSKFSVKQFSQKVITLTQNPHESLFCSLTIFENYLLVRQCRDRNLFSINNRHAREFFAEYLQEFNSNLSHKLDQVVEKLSGGEKQALALALSVLYPPEILLLDEHTSALDPKSAKQLMELTQRVIANHRITSILATHDLDIARNFGNRILALRQGVILRQINSEEKNTLNKEEMLVACY